MDQDRIMNYAEQALREAFPDLPVMPGSGVYDLYLASFAQLGAGLFTLSDRQAASTRLDSYDTATHDDYDKAADFYFVDRNEGGVASCMFRIYFSRASRVIIPENFKVGQNYLYQTLQAYDFGAGLVETQKQGNEYWVQFPVYAVAAGSSYNAAIGEITTLHDALYAPWTRCQNVTAATGGSDIESNEEYFDRIDDSISTRESTISGPSLEYYLKTLYPTFDYVATQGMDDEYMTRDIFFGIGGAGGFAPYYRSDFQYKLSGVIQNNRNVAKKLITEDAIPSVADCEAMGIELDDDEYRQIAGNDMMFFAHQGSSIYGETFYSAIKLFVVTGCTISDSGLTWGQRKYGNNAYIDRNGLKIGVPAPTSVAI